MFFFQGGDDEIRELGKSREAASWSIHGRIAMYIWGGLLVGRNIKGRSVLAGGIARTYVFPGEFFTRETRQIPHVSREVIFFYLVACRCRLLHHKQIAMRARARDSLLIVYVYTVLYLCMFLCVCVLAGADKWKMALGRSRFRRRGASQSMLLL